MFEDCITKFVEWAEKHPYKVMFFVQMPLAIITSLLTTMLLG